MNLKIIPNTIYYFIILIVLVILGAKYGVFEQLYISKNAGSLSLSSLLNSFIGGFLLAGGFFFLLRPSVKIASKISKRRDLETSKDYFTFKFVNSSLFSAFDVHLEAYLGENKNAQGVGKGTHVKHTPVILTRNKWIHIPRWKPVFSNTVYAPHCITVRTLDNTIEGKIRDNSDYLEFRVTLKHAFSNLSSTYRIRYMNEDCFKTGKFAFGNTFDIIS